MKHSLLVLLGLAVCLAPSVMAGTFEKLTFLDPYAVLTASADTGHSPCGSDTTGLDPLRYFAQLDSLGITLSHTYVDAASSNNAAGIGLMGQDRRI